MFGEDVLNRFLHVNNVKNLIRAHQLCMEGYQVIFQEKMVTVWSAPNYLYRVGLLQNLFLINSILGNMASILEIDENLEKNFVRF